MKKSTSLPQAGFANIEVMLVIVLLMIGISVFSSNTQLGYGKALLKAVIVVGGIVGFFAVLILGFWAVGMVIQKLSKDEKK